VVSLHSDNRSESTPGHLIRFCHARGTAFIRSRPYQGNDNAQTPCARILARQDVPEETKKRLLATRAELDLASLLHEIVLCQEQLDEIAKRRQPLVIKKLSSYAHISYDGGVLFQVVWVRGMGRSYLN